MLTNDNDESRRMVEQCYKRHKTTVNPIIEWTDADIWEFIRSEGIPYCGLYDEGLSRLGCIGCPMAGQHIREREFLRWPKYKDSYLFAFGKAIEERKKRGKRVDGHWTNPTDMFRFWMEYDVLPGQIDLFEEEEGE